MKSANPKGYISRNCLKSLRNPGKSGIKEG